jgi:hypothetical protein
MIGERKVAYIVADGSLDRGYSWFGPFDSKEAAKAQMEACGAPVKRGHSEIIKIEYPEPHHFNAG